MLLTSGLVQADDILENLKSCAQTQDQTTRIACYEELGQRVLSDEAGTISEGGDPHSKVNQQTTSDKNPNSQAAPSVADAGKADSSNTDSALPNHIGGAKFSEQDGIETPTYRAFVKSCQQGVDKRWFYILENGQIWKQVDRRKIRHKQKKCGFHATISKGRFGFQLQVDGEERRISVNRFR